MRFCDLTESIVPLVAGGDTETDIYSLCYDSCKVLAGGLFFALRGVGVDGHRFVVQAVAAGAVAVVVEDESFVPQGIPFVKVADSRLAMSMMAAIFYGNPTAMVPLIGITGTNGKTTTSYLIEAILCQADIPAAVLGTVSYRFREHAISAPHTTPESADLQRILRELVDLGACGVVMEVSSHALEQRRVDGCQFDIGVFTNLTRDHLDYHGDMHSYLSSKSRLFSELLNPDNNKPRRKAVINSDDPYGEIIVRHSACPVICFGLGPEARVTAREVVFSVEGIRGLLATPQGEIEFKSNLLGRFNLYNILAAVAVGIAMELPLEAIRDGIEGHTTVPGRMERIDNELGVALLVDYAHTGDALENVLYTLQEIATGRIITVFGCGGDRDRGKRQVMGGIAGRYSDLAIITSDNPRSESPDAIISEVRAGILPTGIREYTPDDLTGVFDGKGFVTIKSRRDAIRLAVRLARTGDIVLVAGKGHEDYQIVGSNKLHFDDREEAAQALREREAG